MEEEASVEAAAFMAEAGSAEAALAVEGAGFTAGDLVEAEAEADSAEAGSMRVVEGSREGAASRGAGFAPPVDLVDPAVVSIAGALVGEASIAVASVAVVGSIAAEKALIGAVSAEADLIAAALAEMSSTARGSVAAETDSRSVRGRRSAVAIGSEGAIFLGRPTDFRAKAETFALVRGAQTRLVSPA